MMTKGMKHWIAASLWAMASMVHTTAGADSHDPITISHGYSFFGDLKYPADFPHLDYVNPNAPKGGEISQWSWGTFDSFNPYARKGRPAALASAPFEEILTTVADDPTASYCLLCSTIEYPQSRDWVIFNLRDDVTFSDGRPMTASDVKFTFELFGEQGIPSYRAVVDGMVQDIQVLGPHKVKFIFTQSYPLRDRVGLAGGIPVFSKAWFDETGQRLDDTSDQPFLGTGQYVLESVDYNQRVVYKRRDDYWGEDLPINIGRGNFDKIRIEYFADSAAAFEGFKAGEYTFRSENSSKGWATQYDFPGIQNGTVIKAELPDGNLGTGQSFVFNLRREKFQDPRVREAIALMLNFEWSNEQLFYGLYDRINSFWENSDLGADGPPSDAELAVLKPLVDQGLLDASILTDAALMAPTSGTRQLDRSNLRRASKLLDDAGWVINADGLREKDGKVFELEFLESSPAFDRVINPYVENLKALGIQAYLNRVEPAQEVDRKRDYNFDMATHQMRMGFEPGTWLEQYFGTKAMEGSSRNLMGISDPGVDALIDIVVNSTTKDGLNASVTALDRVLRAKRFWVPQWYKAVHTVAYYDQYEYPEPLPPFARGELDFWWYNADKAAQLKSQGVLK